MITRNNSCVRLAIFSFHELQKLQIFATGARRGQSGRSASRSYYVLVLRICLRGVDARMPSPRFPLFMIYSSRVQHIFIVYSAYIRHIFITYPFDIHLFYISRCITPTPSLSLYLYPSYINPHTLSLSKKSRGPRDLWSRSGTLSLGRHVTGRGADDDLGESGRFTHQMAI